MPLKFYPEIGTIVICDYNSFFSPEMTKRRPAVVVSPKFKNRWGLCTVVPLSTTDPVPPMPYNYRLHMDPPMPHPFSSPYSWVKCDMVATVSFDRLDLPHQKDPTTGKRQYITRVIGAADLRNIQACILEALGLSSLTAHI